MKRFAQLASLTTLLAACSDTTVQARPKDFVKRDTVQIDTIRPYVHLDYPNWNHRTFGYVGIIVGAYDESGIHKIQVMRNDTLFATLTETNTDSTGGKNAHLYSTLWQTTCKDDGTHMLVVIAYDNSGRRNTSADTSQLIIENKTMNGC